MLVAPFLRPSNGVGDTPPLPYWLYVLIISRLGRVGNTYALSRYCVVGIAVFIFAILYWALWRVVVPKVLNYELVPAKQTLDDGTNLTTVRALPILARPYDLPVNLAVHAQEDHQAIDVNDHMIKHSCIIRN